MHLLQFLNKNGEHCIGVKHSDKKVINLNAADVSVPRILSEALVDGHDFLIDVCNRTIDSLKYASDDAKASLLLDLNAIELLPPLLKPDKVLAIGLNYYDHCKEMGATPPTEPLVFNKFPSTICRNGEDIVIPPVTQQLDYEAELAIVVGREAYQLSVEQAPEYIFGYTVANDVSARDLQVPSKNGGQILLAKSLNKFCPLATYIATKDSLDVENLNITTHVNGELRQSSNTSNMIFKPYMLVSYISRYLRLLPGDLIITGTPPGVGAGMKPPKFVQCGDVVEIEIENIGVVRNKFVRDE